MTYFYGWPEPDPITPTEGQARASAMRADAAALRRHALRYPPGSVYRKGDEAKARELEARADLLDPPTGRTAGQAMAGVLVELEEQ